MKHTNCRKRVIYVKYSTETQRRQIYDRLNEQLGKHGFMKYEEFKGNYDEKTKALAERNNLKNGKKELFYDVNLISWLHNYLGIL